MHIISLSLIKVFQTIAVGCFYNICLSCVPYNFYFMDEFQRKFFTNSESSFRVFAICLQSWPIGCQDLNKLLCLKFSLELQRHVQRTGFQTFSPLEQHLFKCLREIPIIKYLNFSLRREKNETKNFFFPLKFSELIIANSEAIAPKTTVLRNKLMKYCLKNFEYLAKKKPIY